jgi:hypothetical protein
MPKQNQPALRIGKLPDLTPVKLSVTLDPDVHQMLEDYARIYGESYGEAVKPAELVPSMIAGFLATDNGFKRARKALKTTVKT